jgi:hypothetical protein
MGAFHAPAADGWENKRKTVFLRRVSLTCPQMTAFVVLKAECGRKAHFRKCPLWGKSSYFGKLKLAP